MSNPFHPDPLNTPTCDVLNKKWHGTLPQIWKNCMDDPRKEKDPERKDMSDEEKHAAAMTDCCDSEMQCSNPNVWFRKNNISARCVLHKSPDQPHFGDVQMSLIHAHKVKKTLSFGVY